MRKTLLTICLVLSLIGLARVRADIFSKEDTIFSSPEMDGEIYILENIILQDTSLYVGSELKNIDVGDWVSLIPEYGQGAARGYISFNLTNLPESVKIQEATLKICQWKSAGDGVEGCFPVWDVPGGDTLFCILDHIDYGDSLDTLDWTAGDEGDPQTLHSNIGFISKDSIIGWKTLDVTQYIQADIN